MHSALENFTLMNNCLALPNSRLELPPMLDLRSGAGLHERMERSPAFQTSIAEAVQFLERPLAGPYFGSHHQATRGPAGAWLTYLYHKLLN